MARKRRSRRRGRGFARPGSTVRRKVGGRMVVFKANRAGTKHPGKLVPRTESPNIKSNTIPGTKRKRKTVKRRKRAVGRKRVVRRRKKSTVRRTRVKRRIRRRVVRKRKHTKRRTHTRKRRHRRR